MKITAYNRDHNIDLSGSVGVTSITYASTHTALGSNTPLADSGAGTPGSGPQASAWDHVHPASASSAFGSNSTRVSSSPAAGASSSNSRADHVHDGIGTVTASSSNTLNRGTVNLRAGTGVALALSNTDGGSGLDTVTIINLGGSSGGGGSGTITTKDEGSTLSSTVTTLDFVGAGVTASGSGATTTITISGGGGGSVTLPQLVQAPVNAFSSGTTGLAVVFGSTPTSGKYLYMVVGSQSRGATSITQTNVTWTNLYTTNDGTRWVEIWKGVVSGSAGTTATVAFASSTKVQAVGIEMTNNFTATGATGTSLSSVSQGALALSATAGDYVFGIAVNASATSGSLWAGVPAVTLLDTAGTLNAFLLVAPASGRIDLHSIIGSNTRQVLVVVS